MSVGHAPFVGSDVGAQPILEFHLDDGSSIIQAAHVDQELDAEPVGGEEAPAAIDQLDPDAGLPVGPPAQGRLALAVSLYAGDEFLAGALAQLLPGSLMKLPQGAIGRFHLLYCHVLCPLRDPLLSTRNPVSA